MTAQVPLPLVYLTIYQPYLYPAIAPSNYRDNQGTASKQPWLLLIFSHTQLIKMASTGRGRLAAKNAVITGAAG
jgi:hypothetical protein